ncbi:MAG: M28 family peptidase [Gemmatimonadota bacterium]|jgi:aminopeptidase YwaD
MRTTGHLYASALAVVIAILLLPSCTAPPPACDLSLVDQLDIEGAMAHMAYLSESIGPRVVSTPEERQAAEYIAAELEGYGYDVEIQEFPRATVHAYLTVETPEPEVVNIRAGGLRGVSPEDYPLLTPEGGISGRVVYCGSGEADAFPTEVSGHIALVTRSDEDPAEVIDRARAAGAVAVLLHNTDWKNYGLRVAEAEIPFATMNSEAAEALRGYGHATVNLQVHLYETSQNVVATRPQPDQTDESRPIVVFSGHYDSVALSPGANDNASGTAGVMEMARLLARVPLAADVRFLACGGEEGGLVGSRHYVAQLSEAERERVVANFNMDMIATAGPDQTTLFVNTLDGENLVARAALLAADTLGYADLLNAPYQRGASDHVAFADSGIAGANFIWRELETIALEPWYHHPHDKMENVSAERMRIALEIITGASTQVMCAGGKLRPEITTPQEGAGNPD